MWSKENEVGYYILTTPGKGMALEILFKNLAKNTPKEACVAVGRPPYPGDSSTLSALPILMLPLGFLLCLLLLPLSVSVLSPLSLWGRRLSVGLAPQKNRSFSFVPATVKPFPQKTTYRKKNSVS